MKFRLAAAKHDLEVQSVVRHGQMVPHDLGQRTRNALLRLKRDGTFPMLPVDRRRAHKLYEGGVAR